MRKIQISIKGRIIILSAVSLLLIVALIFAVCVSVTRGHRLKAVNAEVSRLEQERQLLASQNSEYEQAKGDYESRIAEREKEISDLTSRIGELQEQIKTQSTKPSSQTTPAVPSVSVDSSRLAAIREAEQIRLADQKAAAENKPICFLTFDDGPSSVTPRILEILAAENVKATFFVIDAGEKNKYIKDIYDAGHSVGIHTATHKYSIYQSVQTYLDDFNRINAVIKEQTGIDTKIMRFPGGSSNEVSKSYCKGIMKNLAVTVTEMGYQYFDWNVSSGDASGRKYTAGQIAANVLTGCANKESACVLMHDSAAKQTTVDALPEMIRGLREMGFTFLPLTEKNYGYHHGIAN